jgi:hypothetical protein
MRSAFRKDAASAQDLSAIASSHVRADVAFLSEQTDDMNEHGHSATLRSAQPGNRNALKTGVYSARARTERAAEIRAAAAGISTFELAVTAVRDERSRLDELRSALDADIAEHGPSTRAGAARKQFTQRSSVVRQLRELYSTWAMGELVDGVEIYDGTDRDPGVGALRDELLGLLALRDLLDLDLDHRGVSTRKGGLRRQVAQRIRVSREMVQLADSIRTAARRVRSIVAPLSKWHVAREIAFDPSQRPSDVLMAVDYLLTHPAPRAGKPLPERFAFVLPFLAGDHRSLTIDEVRAIRDELRPEPDQDLDREARPTDENPSADSDALETKLLDGLQRTAAGVDPRATARDLARRNVSRTPHLTWHPGLVLLEGRRPGKLVKEIVDPVGSRPQPFGEQLKAVFLEGLGRHIESLRDLFD